MSWKICWIITAMDMYARNIRYRSKELMTGYSVMSSALRGALMDLGIHIQDDGKHDKLVYYGDHRYQTTMSKTGSDVREGRNIASKIIKTMF